MKNKFLVLLSISILLSSIILSLSLVYSINSILNANKVLEVNNTTTQNEKPQFKLTREDSSAIIFNEYTGEYWSKFIPTNEAPVEWKKEYSPVEVKNKD